MPELTGNSVDALDFLQRWASDGPWVLTAIDPEKKARLIAQTFAGGQSAEALAFIEHWNGKRNLYFSVNVPRHELKTKAEKKDIGWASALHVDIDPEDCPEGKDPNEWKRQEQDRILDSLKAYEPIPSIIMFSGGGYQGFWLLREHIEIDEPSEARKDPWTDIESYNRKIEKDLGGDHCFNVDRIMRLPGTVNLPDPKKRAKGRVPALAALVRADWGRLYEIDAFAQLTPEKKQRKKSAGDGTPTKFTPAEWVVRVLQNGPDPDAESSHHYKGDRSRALWAVCCALVRSNWSEEDIAEAILDKDNKLSGHVYDQDNPAKYAARQAAKAKEFAGGDFIFAKNGTPMPDQHNTRIALNKIGVLLSYDEFSRRHLIEGPENLPQRHLEDRECNEVYLMIAREFRFRPPRDFFKIMVEDECYRRSFHPLKMYLDDLKWDGKKRVDSWLVDYGKAADSEFTRAVGAITLIAAVRRVRQPGCKFDEIVVLESPQGYNKSTALSILATRSDWFTDSLPLNGKDKEIIEALAGKWIAESPELKGMRRADVEHHKAMLSRQVDRARLSYAHFSAEVPRQCIFIGTTNADSYLRDTTGNRRFWPIRVEVMDVDRLRKDVHQLWAEAAVREASGESIRLSPELYPQAALEQDRRTVDDPWEQLIEDKLNGYSSGKIMSSDIWNIVNVPIHMRTQEHNARLGEVMKKLGWERKKLKFDGKSSWSYAAGTDAERGTRIYITRGENGTVRVSTAAPEFGADDGDSGNGQATIPWES